LSRGSEPAIPAKSSGKMSEREYREAIETMRRECHAKLRNYESSRDYWKFSAITFFFLLLFCILELSGWLAD
jgi:hypothetical protein